MNASGTHTHTHEFRVHTTMICGEVSVDLHNANVRISLAFVHRRTNQITSYKYFNHELSGTKKNHIEIDDCRHAKTHCHYVFQWKPYIMIDVRITRSKYIAFTNSQIHIFAHPNEMAKNVVNSGVKCVCSSRRTQYLEFISDMISFCGLRLEGLSIFT